MIIAINLLLEVHFALLAIHWAQSSSCLLYQSTQHHLIHDTLYGTRYHKGVRGCHHLDSEEGQLLDFFWTRLWHYSIA